MNTQESTNLMFTIALVILVSTATPVMAQNNCGFDNWDGDTNDYLDKAEFSAALTGVDYYSTWDEDGDGILTEDEWDVGVEEYFGDYDADNYGTYSDWDTDTDEAVTVDEFDDGLFDTVDDDDNDTVDQDEWDVFDEEEDGLFC